MEKIKPNIINKKEVCPKCNKEIKMAKFLSKKDKAWICNDCYLDEK